MKVVEGDWVDDLPNGKACLFNLVDDEEDSVQGYQDLNRTDWVKYEGDVVNGLKHGLGDLTFLKDRFAGVFSFDKAEG